MTRLTKPVTRKVPSLSYGDLVVTIAEEGVYYRQPRRRQSFLLPHGAAFQRAVTLHVAREKAEKKAAKKSRRRASALTRER